MARISVRMEEDQGRASGPRRAICWIGLGVLVSLVACQRSWAIEAVAASGRPFGVARVTLPLPSNESSLDVATNGYEIDDPDHRVFYPAFAHRRVLGLLREIVGIPADTPSSLNLFFLFRGDTPFTVTVRTPEPHQITVVPTGQPRLFSRLQRNWWDKYQSLVRLQQDEGDYPPVVESYLSVMLRKRLGLRMPVAQRRQDGKSVQQESLSLVLNVESLRLKTMSDTLEGRIDLGVADQPLPAPIEWLERPAVVAADVPLEAIASRVPEECFYIRFGSFDNYLWLRKFLESHGGSVGQMVSLRGHDSLLSQKAQTQLGLKDSKLAEILGNQLISDVAIIGHDTYLREGAAIGILFEARNGLLSNELLKQRRQSVSELNDRNATLEDVKILDTSVSLAQSPGNEVRSFQVNVDNYHLVTNSRYLAERFLQVAEDQAGALADAADFQRARERFARDNDATVFGFLSPAFFRQLASPHYQIELRRRLRAVTDLELVRLAQWVAKHEGYPHETVDDLVHSGLLPPQFLRRADGSRVVVRGEQFADSLRGSRGRFLPIRDVPIEGVTQRESQTFYQLTAFHQQHWQDMDPLVFEVNRTKLEQTGRERIDLRGEMLPFDQKKYGTITSIIGPATRTQIRQSPNDAITLQVVMQGGRLRPGVGPHHLFFGLQDKEIPIQFADEALVRWLQILRTAPAYLGAWPKLGLLDLPLLRQHGTPDGRGFVRLPFGIWRFETPDGFALLGTDPVVLDEASQELAVTEAEREAQIRVHIADVSQAQIKTWFAAMDFQRAYETSRGNTRLMHAMVQQLGVPQSQAKQAAEDVLGVQLVCPLGGEYQLFEANGRQFWGSTNWPSLRADPTTPGQFASPSMAWFRGLDAEVTMLPDRVTGSASIEVESQTDDAKPSLPFFDFFKR